MTLPLRIADLSITFPAPRGAARVVDRVSLDLEPGCILGLVGESGSGKTLIARAALGILPAATTVAGGRIHVGGTDMLRCDEAERRRIRGKQLAMIFQNPRASLNQIRKAGHQIEDVIRTHEGVSRGVARARALDALRTVRIEDPEQVYHAFPFELSGGMAQRVMIAIAIACQPAVLVADEPTTGLDVSVQASVMTLIHGLARSRGLAVLLITHDLGVAEDYCDEIAVMHAGHLVERASARALLDAPRHPYSAALKAATPGEQASLASLGPIGGGLPDLTSETVPACRFAERCERADAACITDALPLIDLGQDHIVRCHHALT